VSNNAQNDGSTHTTATASTWPIVQSVHVGYMNLAQAATYLGVSVATVRRWVKDRGLPHYYVPGGTGGKSGRPRGHFLFRKGEVDRWVRKHKNAFRKSFSLPISA